MELTQGLRSRRSTKSFLTRPVPREALLELVEAARYSPSAKNSNSWHFVVITERNILNRLSETHPHCRWLTSAQAGIAIVNDPSSTQYWLEDCCVAAYSIWLEATDQGLGVAWGAMYQSDNSSESDRRQKFVRDVLSIPDSLCVPIVLAVGYPDATPLPDKKRPSLEQVIYWERYTGKDSG